MNPQVEIDWYAGSRESLRSLFEEAEDSEAQLATYLHEGRVLVATLADRVVGHLQLVATGVDGEVELKSTAVVENLRGTGIGTGLVEAALAWARGAGLGRMVVTTAAADIDNLRFYQRRGFRFSGIDRDAFDAEAGYVDGLLVDGIPLRDRVWFDQEL